MSDELCTEEYINAPFCSGPSDQDDFIFEDSCLIGLACDPRWDEGGEWWPDEDYVFTPPPFDCAAGPDPDTQEYIDSNWEQRLEDEGCFEEADEETITVVETNTSDPLPHLPETGMELGIATIGIILVIAGTTLVRFARLSFNR